MSRLPDRLRMIADRIKRGETMADIGTDHGLLPLYLWEEGISPRVIMTDASEFSLRKAKGAAGACQFGHELDFRTGDGLKVLKDGEVDLVVIAGMGGLLIREILAEDPVKTGSFSRYILQPRNNSGALRYWLARRGFEITENSLVREGKFICEVIVANSPGDLSRDDPGFQDGLPGEEAPEWEFPPELMRDCPELAAEYAGMKSAVYERIGEGLKRGRDVSSKEIERIDRRKEYFKGLIDDKI